MESCEEEEDAYDSDDEDGSDATDEYSAAIEDNKDALGVLQDLTKLGVNGVRLTLAHFRWAIDDVVGFVFAAHEKLSRSTVEEFLKLREGGRSFRTHSPVAYFEQSNVHLEALPIS